jgi:hypothetical protein
VKVAYREGKKGRKVVKNKGPLEKLWDKKNIYKVERRLGKEKERIGGKKTDKTVTERERSGRFKKEMR